MLQMHMSIGKDASHIKVEDKCFYHVLFSIYLNYYLSRINQDLNKRIELKETRS